MMVLSFILAALFVSNPSIADELVMNNKCGDKPNCVSTFETRPKFFIQPLENIEGPWVELKDKIETKMSAVGNSKVLNESDGFIHFVVTTRILRFKDDVYFWWNQDSKTLNMKSESRVGYSDLGANRKRLKKLTEHWK